ncbi:MAG: hypothetical protein ACI4JB_11475 [Porcipelethomonas sp.]
MIYDDIQRLISYALKNELIAPEDVYVIRNHFMEVFQLTDWQESVADCHDADIDTLLCPLMDYACSHNIISDTTASRDLFDTKLMGIITPMPREVTTEFRQYYAKSPESATNWYYDFSKKLNYVRQGRIARDLKWTYESEYGTLDITINRSKPEKDPKDIAAAKSVQTAAYPRCQLCPENEGFAGNPNHPARQNLRPVPMSVFGESWQLQYSPYGYYNEHCIVFNERHTEMRIDDTVFEKLFDILDYLPHYFVGSNADLPIVGGSILSHEHFQGGRYTFAMERAQIEKNFCISQFSNVQAGIVKWPMSVIRLKSENRGQSQSYGMNYQKLGKELKSQDELAVMDGGKCILQLRGVRPFFSDKYDITRHKNYHMLLDDNPKMEFNIEKYVSDQRAMHLNLSSRDILTEFEVNVDGTGKEDSPAEATEKEKAEAEAEINENAEREIEIGISDSEESE